MTGQPKSLRNYGRTGQSTNHRAVTVMTFRILEQKVYSRFSNIPFRLLAFYLLPFHTHPFSLFFIFIFCSLLLFPKNRKLIF